MSYQTAQTLTAETVRPLLPAVVLTCQRSLCRRLTQVTLPASLGGPRYRSGVARLCSPGPLDKLRLAAFRDAPPDLRAQVTMAAQPVVPSLQTFVYHLLTDQLAHRVPLRDARGAVWAVPAEDAMDAVSDLLAEPLLLGLTLLSFDPALGSFERFLLAFALNDSRGNHQRHLHDLRVHRAEDSLEELSAPSLSEASPEDSARLLDEALAQLTHHFLRRCRQQLPVLAPAQAERLCCAYLSILQLNPDALQHRDRRGNPHLPHGHARPLPLSCGVSVGQERRARELFFQCVSEFRRHNPDVQPNTC